MNVFIGRMGHAPKSKLASAFEGGVVVGEGEEGRGSPRRGPGSGAYDLLWPDLLLWRDRLGREAKRKNHKKTKKTNKQ